MTHPDPLLLIGGTPRSGTTLLRNMLNAHPELAVPDESYFIVDVHRRLARSGALGDWRRGLELIREHPSFSGWGLGEAEIESAIDELPPRDYADLVRALFAAYARSRGKRRAADKTPSHALAVPTLAELFPSSRFVHVLRDPREVCMSLSLQHFTTGGVAEAAALWRWHVTRVAAAAPRYGERMIEVRHERLVADPRAELERVCGAAGIGFDPAMLQPREEDQLQDAHHARARQPPVPELRDWSTELAPRDLATIELIAGPAMRAAGYPLSGRARFRPRAMLDVAAFLTSHRLKGRVLARWRDEPSGAELDRPREGDRREPPIQRPGQPLAQRGGGRGAGVG